MSVIQLVVSFLALSNARDSIYVGDYEIQPDETRGLHLMPTYEPTAIQYGNETIASIRMEFSGTLSITESAGLVFRTHYLPKVTVLITHTQRPHHANYLNRTLSEWTPLPHYREIVVFSTVLRHHERNGVQFRHLERTNGVHTVQQHKMHLVSMLDYIIRTAGHESTLFMFAEDDFPPCDSEVRVINNVVSFPSAKFSGVILAVGMTGMTFQMRDAAALREYIKNSLHRNNKQIDHLIHEMLLLERPIGAAYLGNRRPLTSRSMQFHHIGKVSSQGHHHGAKAFQCGDDMKHANFPGLNSDGTSLLSWSV